MSDLPPINSLVDLVLPDGEIFPSRIEGIDGKVFTVGAPLGLAAKPPKSGSALEVEWIGEDRRHAAVMRLKGVAGGNPPLWNLELVSSVRTQSRRNFVRGGGGIFGTIAPAFNPTLGFIPVTRPSASASVGTVELAADPIRETLAVGSGGGEVALRTDGSGGGPAPSLIADGRGGGPAMALRAAGTVGGIAIGSGRVAGTGGAAVCSGTRGRAAART